MNQSNLLPWLLGLGGLIPFVALTVLHLAGETFGLPPDAITFALATYAATIASFLGGIRWGIAIAQPAGSRAWQDYLVSVASQLLAWAAFALPSKPRLFALAVIILVLGPLDLLLVRRHLAPTWFGRLRFILSGTAGVCLLAAASA